MLQLKHKSYVQNSIDLELLHKLETIHLQRKYKNAGNQNRAQITYTVSP